MKLRDGLCITPCPRNQFLLRLNKLSIPGKLALLALARNTSLNDTTCNFFSL